MAKSVVIRVNEVLYNQIVDKASQTPGLTAQFLIHSYPLSGINAPQLPKPKEIKKNKINKVLSYQRMLLNCIDDDGSTVWITDEEVIDTIFLFFKQKVSQKPGFENALNVLQRTIVPADFDESDTVTLGFIEEAALEVRQLKAAYFEACKKLPISDEITEMDLDQP